MKKLSLAILSIFSLISFSNIDYFNSNTLTENEKKDFQIISTKLAYNQAIKNEENIKYYNNLIFSLDEENAKYFNNEILNTEKIFTRIFKTSKNLVPKIIKYIYFEPTNTNDENLIKEQIEKIMVAFNANTNSKIYINNHENSSLKFLDLLYKRAKKEQVYLIDKSRKDIFNDIYLDILKTYPDKKEFNITELRILIISPSSKIKERLSLANSFFRKKIKGIEIDDFSYLDEDRKILETTSEEIRLKSFEELINGIY